MVNFIYIPVILEVILGPNVALGRSLSHLLFMSTTQTTVTLEHKDCYWPFELSTEGVHMYNRCGSYDLMYFQNEKLENPIKICLSINKSGGREVLELANSSAK